jgi:MerR-like DNA binding protein
MTQGVPARPHGQFLAAEVGELVGVSGTTIGQWARRGYIRASRSTADPHVYALEDIGEAMVVAALLRRGVRRADVRRLREALGDLGPWPFGTATLATTRGGRRPHVVVEEDGVAVDVLAGGQSVLDGVLLEPVPPPLLRLGQEA